MDIEEAMRRERLAWSLFDEFLIKNARDLSLITKLGDGKMGAMIDLMRERLGVPLYEPRTKKRESLPRWLSRRVMERDAYRCLACGTHVDLCVDHVVPVSKGGDHAYDNLQTLCRGCNSRKGTKVVDYRGERA